MRLIDADALMQSLGITSMDCDKCAWYDKEWSCCKRGGDFEDACCAIENAPTIEPERKTGKWIPCSERLPEDGVRVLITDRNGGIEFGHYEDGEWEWLCESGTNYWSELNSEEVIAWMPMPKPMEGGNNNG